LIINILTIFPEMFSPLQESILKRAQQEGIIQLNIINIRDFSKSKHKNTDDYPFGGGAGMLMMVQPIADALKSLDKETLTVYMSPQGKPLTQEMLERLSLEKEITILCGHYEGVDERVIEHYVDEEISIGDYVLTGGELPAMVLVDGISRLIDGVLGSSSSPEEESFSLEGLLEYPQYTRPREYEGHCVPQVLLNGNHSEIQRWRREQALINTAKKRPDLLENAQISAEERKWAETFIAREEKSHDA
jgi:tRNA (guanine37-N1)-methyltransferase